MNPERNRPVSLEDLLRLKQAERPPAEFWSTFDRKLREKQLAALVAKRPWWQRLPRLAPVLARYRFVLGGTAVAAIALVALREEPSAGTEGALEVASAGETVAAAVSDAVIGPLPVAVPGDAGFAAAPAAEPALAAAPIQSGVQEANAAETLVIEPAAVDNFPRVVALGGGAVAVGEHAREDSPSARHIAANLAALRASDQGAVHRVLVGAHGFESRVMPARPNVDPLQQMTPPGDSRRSRLLTAMVSTAAWDSPSRSTERAANRFAEEGAFDQSQRFDARGDRVQVKF